MRKSKQRKSAKKKIISRIYRKKTREKETKT